MPSPDAIIIGAGPAGLACAATMRALGLDVAVLEKAATVGSAWRRHYDRLHLHTDRNHSGLPGPPMPREFPTYPSRTQLIDYLESYAAHFDIRPVFGTEVLRVARDGARWMVETSAERIGAPIVIVATGIAHAPYRPSWPDRSGLPRGNCARSGSRRSGSQQAPAPICATSVLAANHLRPC